MHAFVRVVEAGSFSAVARELSTTQSAVSKQVAALERHLGAPLLARTTRSLSLTEEGQRYFEQARRLVGEVAEAESTVRQARAKLSGWLRVSASIGFGQRMLMPAIQTFLSTHPSLRIDLRLSDNFVDLVEQGIDLAIRVGHVPDDSQLIARRVGTAVRGLYASPGYLESRPARLRVLREPADLAHHACIVYTELATRNLWALSRADGSAATVRVEPAFQSNSSEGTRAAALAGLGITYSPRFMFGEALEHGRMVRVLPDWSAPPLPVQLLTTRERLMAAKVRAFSDHLARNLS